MGDNHNERRLPKVLRYLRTTTRRYPDIIGAPGGFGGMPNYRIPIPPPRQSVFGRITDPRLTSFKHRVHEVELRNYEGTPGCWAYQVEGLVYEFFPPRAGE